MLTLGFSELEFMSEGLATPSIMIYDLPEALIMDSIFCHILYLTGGVHDLEGADFTVALEVVLAVGVLDGGVVVLLEGVVDEADGEGGLAHPAPAQQADLGSPLHAHLGRRHLVSSVFIRLVPKSRKCSVPWFRG